MLPGWLRCWLQLVIYIFGILTFLECVVTELPKEEGAPGPGMGGMGGGMGGMGGMY